MLKEITLSEADVLVQIKAYLKTDKRVAWFGRFNSGRGNLHGRWFVANDVAGCPDILGMTTDGRCLAIEVKKQAWEKPKTETELQQAAFIENVLSNNGVAGFCRSIDEVNNLLKSAFELAA